MKRFIVLVLALSVLCLPMEARRRWIPKVVAAGHATAPVFIAEAHNDDVAVTTIVVTTTINAGDTVVVVVAEALGTVMSITDTGGSVYTQKATASGIRDMEIWGTLSASASTALTVNFSGSSIMAVSVLRYTGVSAFGNNSGNSGVSTTVSLSTTMQDTNNRCVMGALQNAAGAGTATNGIIRLNNFQNNQGTFSITALDNTSASAGALTTSYTVAITDWVAAAIELRSLP